ncbi:MAG: pyrroline-5-carboxylate reductase [Candidatus Aenigmatarchaeota archaeon]
MKKLAIIGGGNMGEALIKGILRAGIVDRTHVILSEIKRERKEELVKTYGIQAATTNIEAVNESDGVIICVKPQQISEVLSEMSRTRTDGKLFISIAAGIKVDKIKMYLGSKTHVVRVMPNTPAACLQGVSAIYFEPDCSEEERLWAVKIFQSVGRTVIIEKEELMDAVTGLSGSGPAFVYTFLEALADGGVKMGLSKDVALMLAAQTIYGAITLYFESGLHPAALRDRVTSPGGTTIYGLMEMERGGFRALVMRAVEAAATRSREISA